MRGFTFARKKDLKDVLSQGGRHHLSTWWGQRKYTRPDSEGGLHVKSAGFLFRGKKTETGKKLDRGSKKKNGAKGQLPSLVLRVPVQKRRHQNEIGIWGSNTAKVSQAKEIRYLLGGF